MNYALNKRRISQMMQKITFWIIRIYQYYICCRYYELVKLIPRH